MTIRVSVVVPTCARPEFLRRCLEALLDQDFEPSAYEIIVVDDGDDEETRRLVACLEHAEAASLPGGRAVSRPRLRYLSSGGRRGPAAARNLGWRAAAGCIIAFTDDDCIPRPHWLSAGVARFADGVAGVAGRVIVPLRDDPTDYERNAVGLESSEFVTANCFYRREALAAVGGFDERFALPWREDSDLFFTLLSRGCRLLEAAEAVVVHPVRPAPWGVSLQQQRKSMFNALLYKKHPALYRQRLKPVRPLLYYWIVATLLAAAGSALDGRRQLAIGASGLWLLLTGRFCARRLRDTSRSPTHIAEMIVTSALIPPLSLFWRLRGALKFRVFFI